MSACTRRLSSPSVLLTVTCGRAIMKPKTLFAVTEPPQQADAFATVRFRTPGNLDAQLGAERELAPGLGVRRHGD
jgi:hypothetical protein